MQFVSAFCCLLRVVILRNANLQNHLNILDYTKCEFPVVFPHYFKQVYIFIFICCMFMNNQLFTSRFSFNKSNIFSMSINACCINLKQEVKDCKKISANRPLYGVLYSYNTTNTTTIPLQYHQYYHNTALPQYYTNITILRTTLTN